MDNVVIFFDSEPYIDENNRTMVPVRAISEALGAFVGWDDATRTVTIAKDALEITLTIGSSTATVNGVERWMDTVPVIQNDRTMVPVRFVSSFLGANVEWDQENLIVEITR